MWICPVCEENNSDMLCQNCGFEVSSDYEHHPTLEKLAFAPESIAAKKEAWAENHNGCDLQSQDAEEFLAAFEVKKHQNGKYAILALKDKSEMTITVPDCVEAIGPSAFEGSDVMQVTLPEGLLKIDDRAFANCIDLHTINIPASLRVIGKEAFAHCPHLDIEIPTQIRTGTDVLKGTAAEKKMIEKAKQDKLERQRAAEKKAQEKAEADNRLRANAEQGDRDAQFELGRRYFTGDGVIKNETVALEWWRKSANQGHAEAKAEVARLEAERKRKEDSERLVQAERLYQDALRYDIEKEKTLANKSFRRAAELGHVRAQYRIALESLDSADKAMWYHKAAEQGHMEAQFQIANRYRDGTGVKKNNAEAVKWYRKAAEQGHARAQYELALAYEKGRGVWRKKAEAIKWYRESEKQGFTPAHVALDRLTK